MLKKLPKNSILQYQVIGPENVALAMNAEDFAEVLGNLIDNARKWAKSLVIASVAINGSRAFVSVEDDGPGISDDQQTRVLSRGVRLDEKVQGSGLGLSIVEAVLEDYGSKLDLGHAETGGLRAGFQVGVRKLIA